MWFVVATFICTLIYYLLQMRTLSDTEFGVLLVMFASIYIVVTWTRRSNLETFIVSEWTNKLQIEKLRVFAKTSNSFVKKMFDVASNKFLALKKYGYKA